MRAPSTRDDRCLLVVEVQPAPAGAVVALRPLDAPAREQPLRGAGGRFKARLPAGPYLLRFEAPGHQPEHRVVELHRPRARLVFHPVPVGASRCRVGGRRVPCPAPAGALTAFLAPEVDARRVVEVMTQAAQLGLVLDTRRVADPGFKAVLSVLPPAMLRPRGPDGEALGPGPLDGRPADHAPVEVAPVEVAPVRPVPIRPLPIGPRRPFPLERLPPLRPAPEPADDDGGDWRAALDRIRRPQLGDRRSLVLPLRTVDGLRAPESVRALRRLPGVTAAGAELSGARDRPAVRRPIIDVRLVAGASPDAVLAALPPVARGLLGRGARLASAAAPGERHPVPDLYRLATPDALDDALEDIADALLATGQVLYAEPRIAERPALLGDDGLSPAQWDLDQIGVADAHAAFGDRLPGEGVTLAVVDEGVRVVDGEVWHDDLRRQISVYDATGRHGGHAHVLHGHGGSVAALAAAFDHPGAGSGTVGVAPHARINAFAHDAYDVTALDETFRVAAGLAGLRDAGGADVVVFACSVQRAWLPDYVADPAVPTLLSGPIFDALRLVALRGRGGRGAVVVVAAGNTGEALELDNPLATSLDVVTCGASDVDEAGVDHPATHSNHGAALDCVAPGYRRAAHRSVAAAPRAAGEWPGHALLTGALVADHDGPPTIAVAFTSTAPVRQIGRGARVVVGPLGGDGVLWTVDAVEVGLPCVLTLAGGDALTAAAGAPVHICDLRLATLLSPGYDGWVDVSDPIPTAVEQVTLVDPKARWFTAELAVRARGERPISGGGVRHTARLAPGDEVFSWPAGAEIWQSASGHHRDFGQTSAASAICAGVAALMLSANPALTAAEVAHLLRETAVSVDGPPDRVGAGRIDAAAAVAAARAYDHPRDLYFESGSVGGRASDSLDVWVSDAPLDAAGLEAAAAEPADSVHDRHRALDPTRPAWVCARVRNRARTDGAPALAAWVRIYVTPAPSGPLRWPLHFTAHPAVTPLSAESHLIGEVWLPPGLAPGAAQVVQLAWPAWATPTGPDDWRRHLAVEVAPHDGPNAGDDNLAGRAVTFEWRGP